MVLFSGAILGFISVAFGAYAEHGLKDSISEESFRQIMTAVRYNQINSAIIISLGLFSSSNFKHEILKPVKLASFLFIIGTIFFCFGIYIARATGAELGLDFMVNLAPIGGMTLMLAWLVLAYSGLKLAKLKPNKL